VILVTTAFAIIATSVFEGVLAGLLLAVARTAWETSHVQVDVDEGPEREGPVTVVLSGNAAFLRLPRILDSLEKLPKGRHVELDPRGLKHLDHACSTALATWADRTNQEEGPPGC
jgi:MFS superfamily sulfate permease-like transporter